MTTDKDYISQLIMEKVLGTISPENGMLLKQLMDENKTVQEQYQLTLDHHRQTSSNGIIAPNPEKSWHILNEKIKNRYKVRRKWYMYAAAAVLLLFALSASIYLYLNRHPSNTNHLVVIKAKQNQPLQLRLADGRIIDLSNVQNLDSQGLAITNDTMSHILHYSVTENFKSGKNALNTLFVPAGKDYKIKLSDGTLITLNAATELKFPDKFTDTVREVYINGEAFLDVAHNAKKPFIVHLPGNGTVRVLGTRFNVNTYSQKKQRVALIQGSVQFAAENQSILLKPGNEAELSNNTIKEYPLNEDALAWLKGEYIMNNTSITEIARIIANWFNVDVVIDNDSTGDKRFSGIIYKQKPLNDFLFMLKGTTDADYYFKGDELHFK